MQLIYYIFMSKDYISAGEDMFVLSKSTKIRCLCSVYL